MASPPAHGGAGHEEAVAGIERRGPPEKTERARFDALVAADKSIDATRFDLFVSSTQCMCMLCSKCVSVESRSNWAKHVARKDHQSHALAAARKPAGAVVQLKMTEVLAVSASAANKSRLKMRMALTAWFRIHAPPAAMQALYSPDIIEALYALKRGGVTMGTAGTMARDTLAAEKLIDDAVDKLLDDGGPISIIIDGASLKLLDGRAKPVAALVTHRLLRAPVLLGIAILESGSAKALADFLLALLVARGIKHKRVVSLMGDNVAFNDLVAEELNVMRGKCLAHIYNLIVTDFTSKFSSFAPMTAYLHKLIKAGSSTTRTGELEARGISVTMLQGYSNRWASLLGVAKYLVQRHATGVTNAEVVAKWMKESPSLKDKAYDDAGTNKAVVTAYTGIQFASNVGALAVVVEALKTIPALIKDASANTGTVSVNLAARVQQSGRRLLDLSKRPLITAAAGLAALAGNGFAGLPQAEMASSIAPTLKAAAEAAASKFDKHMPDALDLLTRRERFDPRLKPVECKGETQAELVNFFAIEEVLANQDTLDEWNTYREEWEEISDEDKAVPMSEFWFGRRDKYPAISAQGQWYAEVQSSSVAAERAFAFMRRMEDPMRFSMKEPAFRAEMSFRVNHWLVEGLVASSYREAMGKAPTTRPAKRCRVEGDDDGLAGVPDTDGE